MTPHLTAGSSSDLSWLLADLLRRVQHTRCALLASTDGIKRYYHGLANDEADALAAWAASQCSLARSCGHRFGPSGGGLRQVVLEYGDLVVFVSAAGSGAVLIVLASPEVNAGVLGHEVAELVKRVPGHLATPMRQTAANRRTEPGR